MVICSILSHFYPEKIAEREREKVFLRFLTRSASLLDACQLGREQLGEVEPQFAESNNVSCDEQRRAAIRVVNALYNIFVRQRGVDTDDNMDAKVDNNLNNHTNDNM